jgi:hypothetical protein
MSAEGFVHSRCIVYAVIIRGSDCFSGSPTRHWGAMCGRYNLRTKLTVLAKQFQFDLDDAFAGVKPQYNIAPAQQVLAVRRLEQGAKCELVELR